ncbi:hypothetical protein [Pseudaquabacterium pictum]|uniref:hypothetical protein n=1 Tax=Pseudaquabacterium pictum TaxID=2315236 RepID=UPI0010F7D873|nr:hypothetical protein [Rubrivivax pictus]
MKTHIGMDAELRLLQTMRSMTVLASDVEVVQGQSVAWELNAVANAGCRAHLGDLMPSAR